MLDQKMRFGDTHITLFGMCTRKRTCKRRKKKREKILVLLWVDRLPIPNSQFLEVYGKLGVRGRGEKLKKKKRIKIKIK